jgi:hypothetical protein
MNGQNNDSNLLRWIHRMWKTQDEEISCSECLDLVPQYVDLALASGGAEDLMPQLKLHLDQCTVCWEEYRILRDLALMEAEGNPPSIDDLKDNLKG